MKTKISIEIPDETTKEYEITHDGSDWQIIRKFIASVTSEGVSFVLYPITITIKIEEL